MPYCPDCGVEIGAAPACPLCGVPNPRAPSPAECAEADPAPRGHAFLADAELERLPARDRNLIAWEILGVSLALAGLIVLASDLFQTRRLSWSLYVLPALAAAWVYLTAALPLAKRPGLALSLAASAAPLLLLALDIVDGALGWSLSLGIPVALGIEGSVGAVALLARAARRRGANVAALVFLAVSADCLLIESRIRAFLALAPGFTWSAIVALCLVPIAAFLFYLHYRIGAKADLRKLFRL